MQGQTLEAAAPAAGMSERSARAWHAGPMTSATIKARAWRTRTDPFAAMWATEIEPSYAATRTANAGDDVDRDLLQVARRRDVSVGVRPRSVGRVNKFTSSSVR